ncbi:hypothetical protein DFH08DRAFT_815527 [Mycena albidolilacea]|uniref:Uncharacterized protein n=1 Tax=Mycena albidolilacea TaxID=1033008 RepID=A0AAD6ZMB1_9AGAR|nr:hypothetical protein DFH08DRAFT_815527 [Mycena albidolilacea]
MICHLMEFAGFPGLTFTPGQMTTATQFSSSLCPHIDLPSLISNVVHAAVFTDSQRVFEVVGHSMLNIVICVITKLSNQWGNKGNDSNESCLDNLYEVKKWVPQVAFFEGAMSQFNANLIAPTPYLSAQLQTPMEHDFIEDIE